MRRALIGVLLAMAGAVALQAQCSVNPASLDFGNIAVGATGTQSFTVNVAAGFPQANFTFSSSNAVFSVSPASVQVIGGQSANVTVTFRPTAAGAIQSNIGITAGPNCSLTPTTVGVAGTGVVVTISPNPLDFGNVVTGNSASLPITVSVAGGALVFLFQPPPDPFTTNDQREFVAIPGQPRTINITFVPTGIGTSRGALVGTAGTLPVSVNLLGNGVTPFSVGSSLLGFGNVLLGCSATRGFSVTPNEGSLDFTVASDNTTFVPAPASFPGSSPQTVQVTFTPTAAVPVTGNLTVTGTIKGAPVPNGATRVVAQGAGFDVVAGSGTVDFGAVQVGVTANQNITLVTAPVTAANLQFSAVSDNPAFTVTMNGNQAQINFRPTAVGAATGAITFTINRTDAGFTPCTVTRAVAVRGVGQALGLTLSPTSVDFGAVNVGTTSPNRSVSLNSTSTLGFTGTVTSSNPAFLVSPASFSLAASGAQAFTLNFRPTAAGAASGTLTFNLTSTSESTVPVTTRLSLQVTGTGQTAATLTVAPTAVDFGDVTVGLAASRTVTVTNTGQATAMVTATPSTATVTVNPSSFSLNGGASQQVVISFLPATTGNLQAQVDFTTGNTTVAAGLTGRGVIPTFTYTFVVGQNNTPISPGGSIGLPTTSVGSSNAVDFLIRNNGTAAGTVGRIVTSGGPFTLLTPPTLPANLGAGETLTVRIGFQPGTPGPATGTLTVDNQTFTLGGVGLVRAVTFTGATSTPPRTQQLVGFQLADRPTTPLTGTLTLEFVPNAPGGDDRTIVFPNDLRTIAATVPANTDLSTFTGGVNQIGFQAGTVAGTITFRLTLQAGGVDVTPSPAPVQTFTVARAAPVIVGTPTIANRTATSFQVVVVGFATTREVNTATFRFNASSTGSLQTSSLTVNVGSAYTDYYNAIAADPNPTRATNANLFGSQFTLTVPFTVAGDLAAIRSVTVTLSNGDGTSAAVDVSF